MDFRSNQIVIEAPHHRQRSHVDASVGDRQLSVWVRDDPTRIWVTPTGELDLATGPYLDQRLSRAQSRSDWILLDLRALTFIDCAGLRTVLEARRRAVLRRHRFEVLCGAGQVARLLRLTGADRLLGLIEPSLPLPVTADQPSHGTAGRAVQHGR